jgi:hypothetical protein
MTFLVTFFPNYAAKQKAERSLTIAALGEMIVKRRAPLKNDLPWLKLARFGDKLSKKGKSLRWDGNVERVSGCVGDYDGEKMSLEEAADLLNKADVEGFLYSSPSYTPEKPRWRVVCPFARELTGREHAIMMARINGLLGGVLAGESFTLSQSYYFGAVGDNPAVQVIELEGDKPVDTLDELDEIAIGKKKPNGKGANGAAAHGWRAWLEMITEEDDARPQVQSAIASYIGEYGKGADLAALKLAIREALERNRPNHPPGWLDDRDEHLDAMIADILARQGDKPGRRNRETVKIVAGELAAVIDKAEQVLVARQPNLYVSGKRVVKIAPEVIPVSGGGKDTALHLVTVTAPAMREKFDRSVLFLKWNEREKDFAPHDCTPEIAERYLARVGEWNLPVLLGVVTAPTIRADGSILQQPGYDAQTGLYFEPNGVEFETVPEYPTKAQALAALEELKELIVHYQFEGAGRSIALSAMITQLIRAALAAAPLHAYDGPLAGSGKTKLANVVSVIATGHKAAAITANSGQNAGEEFVKQLAGCLLAGDTAILLDNLSTPIEGDVLCQITTETKVRIRKFGKLDMFTCPCIGFLQATGNQLQVIGDMQRRALVAVLVIEDERPELREFPFDPVELAMERRPQLVRAVLTIVRAAVLAV